MFSELSAESRASATGGAGQQQQMKHAAARLIESRDQLFQLTVATVEATRKGQLLRCVRRARDEVRRRSGLGEHAFEVARQCTSRLVALLGELREQFHQDLTDGRGKAVVDLERGAWGACEVSVNEFQRIVGLEGQTTGEELVHQGPGSIQIGS